MEDFEPWFWILTQDERNAMSWVILGGAIGGLLLKPLALLQERLLVYRDLQWYESIALGAAAAGVTSFVFGNTKVEQVPHLFFFSVLSGLAFPGLLVAAIDKVSKWTREADLMGELANQSANPKRRPAVAKEASSLLSSSRGISEPRLREQIDQSASTILENLAKSPDDGQPDMGQVIADMGSLGKAANVGGFPATRFNAINKLEGMRDTKPQLTDSDREAIEEILKQL